MCLVLLSIDSHPDYRLILAGNRDEFYERPTASAHFWEDDPNILAGRDLREGGTWMGVTRTGKVAILTNFRDPSQTKPQAASRGHIVGDYLKSGEEPTDYIPRLIARAHTYNDFNLLLGDQNQVYFLSSRDAKSRRLSPGVYGLSNHLLDTPWPKVERGRDSFMRILSNGKELDVDAVFNVLSDRGRPDDPLLPDTGVGLEWERLLSAIFVASPDYGTRSSTILLIDFEDRVRLVERTYNNSNPDEFSEKRFEFKMGNFQKKDMRESGFINV